VEKRYHLGVGGCISAVALSRANENRDWRIFADFGQLLIRRVQPLYSNCRLSDISHEGDIFALDSTTISVSLNLWKWALGKRSRGAVKMHVLLNLRGCIPELILVTDGRLHDVKALDEVLPVPGSIYIMDRAYVDFTRLHKLYQAGALFVVRAKKNILYKRVCSHPIDKSTGLRCDQTIRLSGKKTRRQYPETLRRITLFDKDKHQRITFLTNNFDAPAAEIALLYKHRWDIECFFKWIKQHLQIKRLWGYSENAVKVHIWVAIIAYVLIAWLKILTKSPLSIYEIEQILSISAFDKSPINELVTKKETKFCGNVEPNLFSNSA
jgi:IS4 transposase